MSTNAARRVASVLAGAGHPDSRAGRRRRPAMVPSPEHGTPQAAWISWLVGSAALAALALVIAATLLEWITLD